MAVYEPGSWLCPVIKFPSALILDFPVSRSVRNKCLLLNHQPTAFLFCQAKLKHSSNCIPYTFVLYVNCNSKKYMKKSFPKTNRLNCEHRVQNIDQKLLEPFIEQKPREVKWLTYRHTASWSQTLIVTEHVTYLTMVWNNLS